MTLSCGCNMLNWAMTGMTWANTIHLWPEESRFRHGDRVEFDTKTAVEPDDIFWDLHEEFGTVIDWRVIVEYVQKTGQCKERFRYVVLLKDNKQVIIPGKYLIIHERLC